MKVILVAFTLVGRVGEPPTTDFFETLMKNLTLAIFFLLSSKHSFDLKAGHKSLCDSRRSYLSS